MRIKRREILKAIRTENLKGGAFLHQKVDAVGNVTRDDTCKVCAVGAVLRLKGIPNNYIEDSAWGAINQNFGITHDDDVNGDEFEALEQKYYLNALSIRFERLASKYGAGKKTREKLCRFVKHHFPKTISVNI